VKYRKELNNAAKVSKQVEDQKLDKLVVSKQDEDQKLDATAIKEA
jgi:hypothetical protein